MKISEIAKLAWTNRISFEFGNVEFWDSQTFIESWVTNYDFTNKLWNNKQGLYWISSDIPLSTLEALALPNNHPESGCDFGKMTLNAKNILNGNLCQDFGGTVLYNGQRTQVFSRLRSHFNISNGTGALGISNYSISNYKWTASIFHVGMISSISTIDKTDANYIQKLLKSSTGRMAVESAWRTLYGWPVLCKK